MSLEIQVADLITASTELTAAVLLKKTDLDTAVTLAQAAAAQAALAVVGAVGATGPTGPQGLIGIPGAQGVAGSQGIKGDTGITGNTGTSGLQGNTGVQGSQGIQGNIGSTGSTGPQGIAGIKGDTGIQGVQGTTGLNGTSVSLKGAVATIGTLPSTGNIAGDLWVVSADGNGYVWSDLKWSSVGAIQGPKGDTGLTGPIGATSTLAGPQGVKGDTGIQGTTGNQGSTGIQGLTGSIGLTGLIGISGLKGDTGSQGVIGIQGLTGNTGANGAQGIQGIKGDVGTQGPAGTNGTIGVDGIIGVDGAQGPQGIQGIKGDTGAAGAVGTQGIIGLTGATGIVDPTLLTNEITRATNAENLKANQATTYTKTETNSLIQNIIGTATSVLDTFGEVQAQMLADETGAANLLTLVNTKATGTGTASGTNTGDQILPTIISLGLNNVTNTSDANKPVSTAQATAIALKMTNPFTTAGDIVYAGIGGVPTRLAASTIDNQVLTNHPNGTLSWQASIPGQNATVNIGTITTIASGSNATVTNTGDTLNAILNFALPQGPAGIAGLAGSNSLLIAPLEQWNIVNAAATGIVNIDIVTASVWLYTLPATTSFVLNIRGNSSTTFANKMAIGQSCTIVFANTSGSTPYYPSMFTIDGVQFFPQWSGGLSPNQGNSNSTDMYAYVIVRTGVSTYNIYANQTKFA
jgi:collagen type VII alpha